MSDAIKALAKAQTEMGRVLKTADNPHLKKKYADLGAVIEACSDALHANGFAIIQPCGADDHGPYVETILAHASGDQFTSRVHLVVGKNDMQGVGSAITYARRYGLLGMAGLAPEDDDGEATKAPARSGNSNTPRAASKSDQTACDNMIAAIRQHGPGVASDKNFTKDLAALRNNAPELAARVEAEIETKSQGKAA